MLLAWLAPLEQQQRQQRNPRVRWIFDCVETSLVASRLCQSEEMECIRSVWSHGVQLLLLLLLLLLRSRHPRHLIVQSVTSAIPVHGEKT